VGEQRRGGNCRGDSAADKRPATLAAIDTLSPVAATAARAVLRRRVPSRTFLLGVCLLAACAPAAAPRPLAPAPPPAAPSDFVPTASEWPRREVFELALRAYQCGAQEGRFSRPMLTVIDYSLPASEPRLWVIDLEHGQVLHHELVAHGDRSGENLAVSFSNQIDSHQSSLGLFRTDEAYSGRYGYALRLSGLEPGINDNARQRAIVFHGSPEVSRDFIAQWGTIGRSWGCPALPEEVAAQVIDGIAGGSAVFAYYPDGEWLRASHYLHCGGEPADALIAQRD
jgi:hypothetical protein